MHREWNLSGEACCELPSCPIACPYSVKAHLCQFLALLLVCNLSCVSSLLSPVTCCQNCHCCGTVQLDKARDQTGKIKEKEVFGDNSPEIPKSTRFIPSLTFLKIYFGFFFYSGNNAVIMMMSKPIIFLLIFPFRSFCTL